MRTLRLTFWYVAVLGLLLLAACGPAAETTSEPEETVLYTVKNPVESLLPQVLVYPVKVPAAADAQGTADKAESEPVVPTLEWASFRLVLGEPLQVLEEGLTARQGETTKVVTVVRAMNGTKAAIDGTYLNPQVELGTVDVEQPLYTRPSITAISPTKLAAGTVFGIVETSEGFSRILYKDPTGTVVRDNLWIAGAVIIKEESEVLANILRILYNREASGNSELGKKVLAIAAEKLGNNVVKVNLADILARELASTGAAGGKEVPQVQGIGEKYAESLGLSQAVNLRARALYGTTAYPSLDAILENGQNSGSIVEGAELKAVHIAEYSGLTFLKLDTGNWINADAVVITN